jgi:ABC-type microcin C transport system duplicated ATPase subunit YejF
MVMKEGQIIEAGDTEDVFKCPQKTYTKNLLTASLFNNTVVE